MLFENKPFSSHGGITLSFKIECDALNDADLATLADLINRGFVFGKVYGVPRGGTRLADALRKFCVASEVTLIVDDVFTTGASMENARQEIGENSVGVVIFARADCPSWIHPIFQLSEWARP